LLTFPPPPDLSPLSLHDALPICQARRGVSDLLRRDRAGHREAAADGPGEPDGQELKRRFQPLLGAASAGGGEDKPRPTRGGWDRSEEHTSELQSLTNLVCRLLLE